MTAPALSTAELTTNYEVIGGQPRNPKWVVRALAGCPCKHCVRLRSMMATHRVGEDGGS